jgi:hypothetical protein
LGPRLGPALYKLVAAIAEMLAQRVIAMNEKVVARSP